MSVVLCDCEEDFNARVDGSTLACSDLEHQLVWGKS